MDFALTGEQQMVVDTVRDFVERELYPHEDEVERTGRVPPELGEEIKRKVIDLGFYAPNLPAEVGGGGLDHLTCTLLERELGRPSMALSVFWGRPSGILMACNAEQRARYLLPAARGEQFDALAMTEPAAGSDVRGMQCAARPDGGDWILSGSKHFISHADLADFVIVFVATGEEETARGPKKRITCFLVDRGTPGFEIRPGYESVSHRGYANCILAFDECRLPAAQILGDVHRGFDLANEWLYGTRLTVAAMCVGRARRAFALALDHAAQRHQFGQPIGRFQGVSFKLADMITEIDAADWLTLAAALAPGPWPRGGPGDRVGQALCDRDAGPRHGRGRPGVRGHGPHKRPAAGAFLAGRPGGTHLGRHIPDPAAHHRARPAAPPGGLSVARDRGRPVVDPRLARVLRPRTIAMIGGSAAAEAIAQCDRLGFDGTIWPVHPTQTTVGGRRAFRTVEDLPRAPDVAFVAVNREATLDIVRELARHGAGGAVCYASGFREAEDGSDLKDALVAAAGEMPVVGPNCYGLLNYLDRVALWPDQHGGGPSARRNAASRSSRSRRTSPSA